MELRVLQNILVITAVFASFRLQIVKGLSRSSSNGVSSINFKSDEFFYLNITSLGSDLVQDGDECGFACLEITSCFSYNLAALPDINGKLLCELLPSDKYNNSDKFVSSEHHHHYSISTPCSSGPCLNGGSCMAKYDDNDYQCACAIGYTGRNCAKETFLNISIRSEGCDDPDRTVGTCGIAYIIVNGKDYSLHGRGHNVVTVDAKTGKVLGSNSFDTHGDASAGENLRDHLNAINGSKIVLVVIQDEGSSNLTPALDAIRRLGATDPILTEYRSSFALVGYSQSDVKPYWNIQQQKERYNGPTEISVTILLRSSQPLPADCQDIKKQRHSHGDGVYWMNPAAGNTLNAFLAYCDMTSYNGGWTMCYTTDEYVKPKTEVTYSAQLPYGSDGYRTNCNNITFTEIIFVDHQTGNKTYFKRQTNQSIMAAANYGKNASTYGLWEGVGTISNFSYQLLICDDPFYSGFFVSGYTSSCYKQCLSWCGDSASPYFRTAANHSYYKGVAFKTNGHYPHVLNNSLISVGLR